MLRIEPSGVRNSWLMYERKRLLSSEASRSCVGLVVELGVERDHALVGLRQLGATARRPRALELAGGLQLLAGLERSSAVSIARSAAGRRPRPSHRRGRGRSRGTARRRRSPDAAAAGRDRSSSCQRRLMPSECMTSSARGGHCVVELLRLADAARRRCRSGWHSPRLARRRDQRARDVADAGVATRRPSASTRAPPPRRRACPTGRGASRSIRIAAALAERARRRTRRRPARAASAASGPWPRPSTTSTAQSPSRSATRQASPQTSSCGAGIETRRFTAPERAATAGPDAPARTRDTTTVPSPARRVDVELARPAAAPRRGPLPGVPAVE